MLDIRASNKRIPKKGTNKNEELNEQVLNKLVSYKQERVTN